MMGRLGFAMLCLLASGAVSQQADEAPEQAAIGGRSGDPEVASANSTEDVTTDVAPSADVTESAGEPNTAEMEAPLAELEAQMLIILDRLGGAYIEISDLRDANAALQAQIDALSARLPDDTSASDGVVESTDLADRVNTLEETIAAQQNLLTQLCPSEEACIAPPAGGVEETDLAVLRADVLRLEQLLDGLIERDPDPVVLPEEPKPEPVTLPEQEEGFDFARLEDGSPVWRRASDIDVLRAKMPSPDQCQEAGLWFLDNVPDYFDTQFFVTDGTQIRRCTLTRNGSWEAFGASSGESAHVLTVGGS